MSITTKKNKGVSFENMFLQLFVIDTSEIK